MKFLWIFLLFLISSTWGFCAESASQNLNASIPNVYEIEKIIVELQEYHRDEHLSNMTIKNSTSPNANQNILELSPVKVQIRTNMSTPIVVYADFKDLKHKQGEFNFNKSNLSVSPSSYTINNPYDHVISGIFTPYATVTPDAVQGDYRGTLTFTLGGI